MLTRYDNWKLQNPEDAIMAASLGVLLADDDIIPVREFDAYDKVRVMAELPCKGEVGTVTDCKQSLEGMYCYTVVFSWNACGEVEDEDQFWEYELESLDPNHSVVS